MTTPETPNVFGDTLIRDAISLAAKSPMTSTQESPTKNLVAGRELDALIAEKVMGFKYEEVITRLPYSNAVRYSIPHYSTSIEAALAVVERLRARQRIAQENGTSDQQWIKFVSELPRAQHEVHYMLRDLTAEALCLAALKAVGA